MHPIQNGHQFPMFNILRRRELQDPTRFVGQIIRMKPDFAQHAASDLLADDCAKQGDA
jgi:hypothetical protein